MGATVPAPRVTPPNRAQVVSNGKAAVLALAIAVDLHRTRGDFESVTLSGAQAQALAEYVMWLKRQIGEAEARYSELANALFAEARAKLADEHSDG